MAKATKEKTPKPVEIHPAVEPLQSLIADLETKIGDGGTVEERQAIIDRLKNVLELLK